MIGQDYICLLYTSRSDASGREGEVLFEVQDTGTGIALSLIHI